MLVLNIFSEENNGKFNCSTFHYIISGDPQKPSKCTLSQ